CRRPSTAPTVSGPSGPLSIQAAIPRSRTQVAWKTNVTRPATNVEHPEETLAIRLALAVFILTLVLFLPVCRNDYVNYDDPEYITANPMMRAGPTKSNLAWAFTTTVTSNWHPLTWISLQLDRAFYGQDADGSPRAAGVHFTNALLHAVNAG